MPPRPRSRATLPVAPKHQQSKLKAPAPARAAKRAAGNTLAATAAQAASDLAYAREVVRLESVAVGALGARLDGAFARAVELVLSHSRAGGRTVVTGMGKPGFIAQKLSATFSSTGTPSLYLHPAEALHGDLGRLVAGDLVLALSNSGETDEVVRLLPALRRLKLPIIALTSDPRSQLARAAEVVLEIGPNPEACPLGLAPTTSTIALLALGDALAMTVLHRRGFSLEQFAELHPGGSLGRRLLRVREVMRTGRANPLCRATAKLSEAVAVMTRTEGRPGATSVVDAQGKLVGIFTDGDLRRMIEAGHVDFSQPVSSVMGKAPRTVDPDDLAVTAADLLRERMVDQVPVVDASGKPVGLLDVQDLLAARLFG
jgi:arabinose-5-phosphate isomerase